MASPARSSCRNRVRLWPARESVKQFSSVPSARWSCRRGLPHDGNGFPRQVRRSGAPPTTTSVRGGKATSRCSGWPGRSGTRPSTPAGLKRWLRRHRGQRRRRDPKVLEGIMDAAGAELEVLPGLSSQMCIAIPGDFARELEHGQNKERFIKRLVNSLNAYMNPAVHFPGVRRAVVELAVSMMESDPSYTKCFIKCRMMEALTMVEWEHSRDENYRYFSGGVGLMEHRVPLSALVSRAKELVSGNGLYWDS